jgi:hypothetical protein
MIFMDSPNTLRDFLLVLLCLKKKDLIFDVSMRRRKSTWIGEKAYTS